MRTKGAVEMRRAKVGALDPAPETTAFAEESLSHSMVGAGGCTGFAGVSVAVRSVRR